MTERMAPLPYRAMAGATASPPISGTRSSFSSWKVRVDVMTKGYEPLGNKTGYEPFERPIITAGHEPFERPINGDSG